MALLLDDKSSSCKTPASSNGATYGSHQLSETPPHLSKDKDSIPQGLQIYEKTMKKLSKRFY
jgi:hypothetical protein